MSPELPEPLDVIAVGAHPDDVEIAVGGTLARLVKQGHRVGIVDLTDGEPTPNSPGPEIRRQEALAAAAKLGIQHRIQLDLPNRRLFDCFESPEVKNGVGKIASLLKADGLWMNADFRFFHNHALHQRIAHRLLIQFLYGFFHLTTRLTAATLVCVETLGCKSGFKVVETFKHAFLPLSSEVYRRY